MVAQHLGAGKTVEKRRLSVPEGRLKRHFAARFRLSPGPIHVTCVQQRGVRARTRTKTGRQTIYCGAPTGPKQPIS